MDKVKRTCGYGVLHAILPFHDRWERFGGSVERFSLGRRWASEEKVVERWFWRDSAVESGLEEDPISLSSDGMGNWGRTNNGRCHCRHSWEEERASIEKEEGGGGGRERESQARKGNRVRIVKHYGSRFFCFLTVLCLLSGITPCV